MQAAVRNVKTPWRRPEPDAERMDKLLDAAAAEFNASGVSGASLAQIARKVGLTRAAIYYYVESREDLAFRCYQRACEATAADLAAARKAANGLERVHAFIERTLAPTRAPAVVLSEIACLTDGQRAEIEAAHGKNIDALRRFVRDGIADKSVRECDPELIAQAIFGMVSWAPLAEEWSAGTGESVRRHAAQAIADLISDGVAADPDYPFACPLDVASLAFQPGNTFDRGAASAMKVELLLKTASRLFNRRGIDGTSVDQIAQALGATKGAFYHHMDDKDTLVVECHRRQLDLSERIVEAAGAAGKNGLERALFGLHLLTQAFASDVAPLSPLTGVEALPAKARAAIRKRGQALAGRYTQYNRDGIKDGTYRKFDVRTLAITGAGAFSWIPKWRTDGDPRTPRQVADEMTALFLRGIRRRA